MNNNRPELNGTEEELDIELIDVDDTDDTDEINLYEFENELSLLTRQAALDRHLRDSRKRAAQKRAVLREVLSYVQIFLFALVLAYIVSFHVIVNATVPTGSMSDTIMVDDRVIGLRLAYLFSSPARGDIIIFKFPDNEEEDYIKRIIGIPGDTVEIVKGQVFVNGILLIEDYIAEPMIENVQPLIYQIPEDCYFVMGDNRNHSHDSRYWKNTYVRRDKIIGKALFKYYKGFELLK